MLADLPSVDRLSRTLDPSLPDPIRVEIARHAVSRARAAIDRGETADATALAVAEAERVGSGRLRLLINATGVLLHTNLGRAPLHPEAAAALTAAATGYTNLEFDLTTGRRGGRGQYISQLITALTGAERSLVVNNNAAALYLALVALGKGGRVPVSRGELIEIGGSYRLPDLMGASAVDLVEVGTTNRTRLRDFAAVDDAALFLRVHPSNYRVEGFVEDVPLEAFADLAAERSVPLIFDVGSGLLDRSTPWIAGPTPAWLRDEPDVKHSLSVGASVVTFSGDKLLGGPQAGILTGDADLIEAISTHPVARAVRLDGPRSAALATTLELYASGRGHEVPFWQMALASQESLLARIETLRAHCSVRTEVVDGASQPGAGSVPGMTVPSPQLALHIPEEAGWWDMLRHGIVASRRDDRLVLDLRTVPPESDSILADALTSL